ncbi:hypothetical protein O6H91_10G029600 [Diphasiastrum complanatum]|uniref:Uncharacterized protein n=1 Tax=Diphasiastrum complanatum TaxID=34168 RepID=A0ACC2CFH9_DIPCM|nr:hypothetical protein O6H91_10G029600 [Diphasiastrum complanatum]
MVQIKQEGRVTSFLRVSCMASFRLWSLATFLFMVHVHVLASSRSQQQQPEKICLNEQPLHSKTFLSEAFTLGPGDVQNKVYHMEFPTGHIAVRSFFAEVVDELGVPVPLYELYLHHWIVVNIYVNQSEKESFLREGYGERNSPTFIMAGNDGVCPHKELSQIFGLGSETRRTNTSIPSPYGIVVGDPNKIPDEYEELWLLNVHAIDTREVLDRQGCTECRCNLYNVTAEDNGKPLKGYVGGLRCCEDGTHCRLGEGLIKAARRKLFLQYTVKWVEFNECVIPVKVYIFDVTETGNRCQVEYDTPSCPSFGFPRDCIDTRETRVASPQSGEVIYGVAHQHSGGKGASLYGEDGREICTSLPLYGSGTTPGDEAGYVVGMSSCYPKPGSLKIEDKEVLRLQSNYSTNKVHTGVMGLFYLLVASPIHGTSIFKDTNFGTSSKLRQAPYEIANGSRIPTNIVFGIVMVVGVSFIVAFVVAKRNGRALQYEALTS